MSSKDGFGDSFRALHYVRWGAQTTATDQSVSWYESGGVFECLLHGVDHGPRTFADEVRIQLFAMRNPLSHEIPPIVMPLREPCA